MKKPKESEYYLIDTSVNLTDSLFDKDYKDVVRRSIAANIKRLIITGTTLSNSKKAQILCHMKSTNNFKINCNTLYFTAGIHPHHSKKYKNHDKNILMNIVHDPKCVAICSGLDYDKYYSPKSDQINCLLQQIKIAHEINKPLIACVHGAHSDFIEIMTPRINKLNKIIIRCFTGNLEEAQTYLSLGFYLSLSGFICMDKGDEFRKNVLPHIPLNKILLETNAPYMHPDYKEQKKIRSEPINTINICHTIAKIKNIPYEEVAAQTTKNAICVFNLS